MSGKAVGLTPPEIALVQKLGECWNDFQALPSRDPYQDREVMQAIHAAQNVVMAYAARRAHPEIFRKV